MSRRRRRDDETEGDILSEDEGRAQEEKSSNATESDLGNDDLYVSDYESLDEETRQSSDDETEGQVSDQPQQQPANKRESVVDGDAQKEVSKPERESGDGKEQSDTEPHKDEVDAEEVSDKNGDDEKVEDDPSFIPTKGAFFMHDLRSDDQPKGRGRDRRIWDKDPVKWKHDMFVMEEQMPKSRDMLISNYGYDIRERPIDAPPPSDRRPRGRGRGGFRGRGRGRPQNVRRNQQRAEYSNENTDYKEDYPALNSGDNQNSGIKVKSKSYYKRTTSNSKPPSHGVDKAHDHNESIPQKEQDNQEEKHKEGKPSSSTKANEQEGDEKLSELLQVINKRENAPSSKEVASTAPSNSRRFEGSTKNFQHGTTFSNYQEAPKPRRYSSLRQRQTNSPVDKQQPSEYSPRARDNRYANFSRPVQPTQSVNFPKKSNNSSDSTKKSQSQTIPEEPKYPALPPQTTIPSASIAQPVTASSIPHAPVANQQPLTFSDPSTASMGGPLDHGLMQMPQMPFQYNPMLNSMHDAAMYQRMMRMMSQQMLQMNMSVDQLPQLPTSLPHAVSQIDGTGAAIPPDPQSLPHPTDMQMNPLIPPVSQTLSQGSLGSVMRPPPPPLNPPTYFTGPMGMNMTAPQQTFPYPPNLVAQQVGGVTYFNTPTQSPPVQPTPNQASPRRNAAIPIMAPTGFGTHGMME